MENHLVMSCFKRRLRLSRVPSVRVATYKMAVVVMVMVELLLPRVSCRPPEAVLEPEQTVRRAVAVRFDRSITCVFRQQPSPSVRTIDKTMVDGHGFRVPRPPTAPRGTGTTPTTRVAATQVAAAQTTAIGPFGLRSRAQVRTRLFRTWRT